jgi:hypothetical protein
MKIRTAAQLEFYLDELTAWRKKELTQILLTVGAAGGDQQRMLLRAGVALLYAHWEGFVKDAASAYVQLAASQDITVGDLADAFKALALGRYIRAAGQSGKSTVHVQLVQRFTTGLGDKARISWRRAVATNANLRGRVFREIVETVGLSFDPYALKMKPVVDRLVDLRNRIAHGRGIPVDQAEYAMLHQETISLVDAFKTHLADAAAAKRYRQ